MSFEIHFNHSMPAIVCKIAGESAFSDDELYARSVMSMAKEHPCKRILIDIRDGKLGYSLPDL